MHIAPSRDGKKVFSIPCDNPAARDGVFYCIPSFFQSEHMWDRYSFLLVDTKKVIAGLKTHNPGMMQHAEYKFSGETVEDWLEYTSFEQPRDMGFWVYGAGRPLSMSSGQASLIKVVELLDLPCFPIAVEKHFADEIDRKFGYSDRLSIRPLFTFRRIPNVPGGMNG